MTSIFEDIVRSENDYTQLLCNLMQRDVILARGLISFFTRGEIEANEIDLLAIKTQEVTDRGNGIPDVSIEADGFHILIEVKVDVYCPATASQKQAYAQRFSKNKKNFLCLLVPFDWRRHDCIPEIQEAAERSKISFSKCYWHEVSGKLSNLAHQMATPDGVVKEATQFLKRRFEMVDWSSEERAQLGEKWVEKVSAIRKLEKIVDQVKARAQAENWQTEGEYADPTEYGFYIKHGGKYLLWVGIWTVAPTPISYGFDKTWVEKEPSLKAIVGKWDKQEGRWFLFGLPDQSYFDSSKVWDAIESKLKQIRLVIA